MHRVAEQMEGWPGALQILRAIAAQEQRDGRYVLRDQAIGALHGYFEHDYTLMIGMLASLVTCGSVRLLAAHYR